MSQGPALIAQAEQATPLPPGMTWDRLHYPVDPSAHYEAGFFREMVEAEAQCKWYRFVVAVDDAGDAQGLMAASSGLAVLRATRHYLGTDPATRQYYLTLEAAALAGNPAGLERFITLNCRGVAGFAVPSFALEPS
ncbi:MAG TPA: hypothetical protein VET65_03985 [Candidatus Limnocylindrales bacterium]|nr:hypothetical protein [Candidatus Limnocylindrales bacterium]